MPADGMEEAGGCQPALLGEHSAWRGHALSSDCFLLCFAVAPK